MVRRRRRLGPTNAILVQDDHIVLPVGRDDSDGPPIDGIILAPGVQPLKVDVDAAPETAPSRSQVRSETGRA